MKNERGYRLKANHFSPWSRPMKITSDVPVSRNDIKLYQIYTKFICVKFWKSETEITSPELPPMAKQYTGHMSPAVSHDH